MKIPHKPIVLTLLFISAIFLFTDCAKTASMRRIDRNSHRAGRSIENSKSAKVQKAEAKQAKQKEDEKKAYEKKQEKELKHREKMQTKATRERMKETRNKADKNNDKYKEPFFRRIFGRKKPKT
jgi:ABC-type bacteriocin/lantibiotic exporter with double-glycine peptidase domain